MITDEQSSVSSQIYYFDHSDAHSGKRELAKAPAYEFKKDPNDVLKGKGQFISQEQFTSDLKGSKFIEKEWHKKKKDKLKEEITKEAMRFIRKGYYVDEGSKIVTDGYSKDLDGIESGLYNYTSKNSYQLNKAEDAFSTFDDGLIF